MERGILKPTWAEKGPEIDEREDSRTEEREREWGSDWGVQKVLEEDSPRRVGRVHSF